MTYTLYMSGGFREWEVGDEVLVEYVSRAQRRAATSNSSTTTRSLTDADSLAGGSLTEGASSTTPDEGEGGDLGEGDHHQVLSANDGESAQSCSGRHSLPKLLPAVITGTSTAGGLFDIRWNDGERERGVRRNRIHRAASPRPPWTIIYEGEDCRYAVEGMVPESIVERERNFPYEVRQCLSTISVMTLCSSVEMIGYCCRVTFCEAQHTIIFARQRAFTFTRHASLQVSANFSLQTKGTEVPRDKLSRHSPVVTMQTNSGGQGPVGDGRYLEKSGGAPTSVKARFASAKALDHSISASTGVGLRPSSSEVHRPHGQYVATGKGAHYL